jgi:hypothetical protein
MRKAFLVATTALLVAFVFQFAFAAVGAFTKPGGEGAYILHSVTGSAIIPGLTLLTIVLAVLAKAPGRLVGLTALPLGLVVLQALLAMLANASTDAGGTSTPFGLVIAGLHALNGIIAVHVVVSVHQAARKLAGSASADTAPVAVRESEPV